MFESVLADIKVGSFEFKETIVETLYVSLKCSDRTKTTGSPPLGVSTERLEQSIRNKY